MIFALSMIVWAVLMVVQGNAKCFAGDVGSIGIAFIILFALGRLMLMTKDVTYIVFFLVYGIDGSLTIFHRIMLHVPAAASGSGR